MLCDPRPPLSLPLAPLLLGWGAFPGWLPTLWAKKEVTLVKQWLVPGVSEVKLVEKVARKQQEMLPSRPRPALAKWEPWSQGVWDRWPSPGEETQVTPPKARPPPTPSAHTNPSHRYRSVLERPALFTGDKFHLQNRRTGCREGRAELESAEVAAAAGCHVLGRDELRGGRSSGL